MARYPLDVQRRRAERRGAAQRFTSLQYGGGLVSDTALGRTESQYARSSSMEAYACDNGKVRSEDMRLTAASISRLLLK